MPPAVRRGRRDGGPGRAVARDAAGAVAGRRAAAARAVELLDADGRPVVGQRAGRAQRRRRRRWPSPAVRRRRSRAGPGRGRSTSAGGTPAATAGSPASRSSPPTAPPTSSSPSTAPGGSPPPTADRPRRDSLPTRRDAMSAGTGPDRRCRGRRGAARARCSPTSPPVTRSTSGSARASSTSSPRCPRLARPFDEHADPVHVTGSAFIVGPRGIVLLRHRRLGIWVQPGGHVDAGETPWDGARREAVEETGLPVRHLGRRRRSSPTSTSTPAAAATPTSTCATCSTPTTPIPHRRPARARTSAGSPGPTALGRRRAARWPASSPPWPPASRRDPNLRSYELLFDTRGWGSTTRRGRGASWRPALSARAAEPATGRTGGRRAARRGTPAATGRRGAASASRSRPTGSSGGAGRRCPTPSCTATPTSRSSTARRTPRSWPPRRPASASRRWPSPTTTGSTASSASPRRPGRSGCRRCSAPRSR